MDKFFENFIIDDVEAYHEDGFCAIFSVLSIIALIICIVLLAIPSITTPDRITDGLYNAKTKAIFEYLDRSATPIIGTGVQPKNGKETSISMVPMVFPLPETPERCVTPKEEPKMTPIAQKADVKHMPATLKAVPGKPLSEAKPANSNFEVKKGPTYTWKSSGNTVKIIYPDGKVEIVSKSLLPYLLGK